MLPEDEFGFLSNNADVDLKALMKSWERTFQELFGIESMTYNVHLWVRKYMFKLTNRLAGNN